MRAGSKGKRRWAALPVILALMACSFMGNFGNRQTVNAEPEQTGQEGIKLSQPENINVQGYDVIYVIDNSRSVWKQQEIRNQAFRNISNLAIGTDIRVGVLYFADHLYDKYTLSLTPMETEEDSKAVLNVLKMRDWDNFNVDTNIGRALEKAVDMFDGQDATRKRIIILFSDGINENLAGDSDYAEEADEKTREQAAILKEMDIPIYCVYLEKNRNDEAYLRSLVNYFSDDLSYDQERFSKVTEDEIHLLPDRFADVFYAMQDNMKFRKLELDSAGKMRFYIPALGVRNLRICVDGETEDDFRLTAPTAEEYDNWRDGNSAFISYDMPPVGDWTIECSGSAPENVHGTIACYAYLCASAQLITVEESENKSEKSHVYQLTVRFYDENGNEVKIDPAATVSADVVPADADSQEESLELEMSVEDGVAKSKPFRMAFYGDYRYRVNLTEDFVNLNYTLEGGTVGKNAPVPSDMEGKWFFGEQTEEGFCFSIRADRLYQDPEGESVEIRKVVQLNENNPAEAELRDGYVYVTARKQGRVNITLQLIDSSGMEAEVTVEGTVISRNLLWQVGCGLIIGICLFVLCVVLKVYGKRKTEKRLDDQFVQFFRIGEDFDKLFAGYTEEESQLQEYQEDMAFALQGDDEVKGLTELAGSLTERQQEAFLGLEKPEDSYEELLSDMAELRDLALDVNGRMKACVDSVETIKERRDNAEQADREMERKLEEASALLSALGDITERQKKLHKNADEKIAELGRTAGAIERMLETDITCNLTVTVEGDSHTVQGRKSCKNNRGEFLKGYYRLDEVKTLENGKLSQCIGETGIYVYGYAEESGETGLRLESDRPFAYKLLEKNGKSVSAKEAILRKNRKYELQCAVEQQTVQMKLTIN